MSQSALGKWSEEDRAHFTELLWLPQAEEDMDIKVRMVRFIGCITKYYEEKYPFSKVLERWNSKEIDVEFLSEFMIVNDRCSWIVENNKDIEEI